MPPANQQSQLDRLINDVSASPKYSDISLDLIRRIGAQELAKRRSFKEALKSTRNKLHQIGGAYFDGRHDYSRWLDELRAAARASDRAILQQACRTIMSHHASTKERLSTLDQFYAIILADLPPIRSVIDVACGLNPLAIPWMPLETDAQYYACDIYRSMLDFLADALALMPVKSAVQQCDIIQACPAQQVDLALVLKTLPCLEQVDRQAGYHLLHALNARYLIVSFPVHSLGGHSKGMTAHYEAHFRELIRNDPWDVQRITFPTELVFVVKKAAL
ncbi:MAG TPA: hypothetical protein VFB60_08195 [Ktedonobacteraceae bacterium]|nr:hypothetical protein [Ktedonobacteraceae bacterium]